MNEFGEDTDRESTISSWMRGGFYPHTYHSPMGDRVNHFATTARNNPLPRVPEGGDFTGESLGGMFHRMRMIYQYEASQETLEHYSRVQEQLEEGLPEETMAVSDLDSLGRPETTIYGSSWCLSSSFSSSESQPSSTDSEVHRVSSSSSDCNNEKLKINEPTESAMENIPVDLHESSSSASNSPVSDPSDENPEYHNTLENNLLLQACILDLNDLPMTPVLYTIARQTMQLLFDAEEILILDHFINYRVRISIEQINQRLAVLTLQQNEVLATLDSMEFDSEDSDDYTDNYQHLSSFESDEPEDPLGIFFQTSDAAQETESDGETNSHTQNDQNLEPGGGTQQVDLDCPNTSVTEETGNHEISPDGSEGSSSILLEEESWESGGRTAHAVEIMTEMVPLPAARRERLLRQRGPELSDEEHGALLQFMDAAEDSRPARQGFWRRLRARMQITRSLPLPGERRSGVSWWRRQRGPTPDRRQN